MTFKQALNELRDAEELSTDMLKPLGVSFETFLKYSQLSAQRRLRAVHRLIFILENKR